jgi:hypothetical protein
MSNRLNVPEITMPAVLVAALATALVCRGSVHAQSFPPVRSVPAPPGKYDFQWEKFTARAARGGRAFYIFEGQQPVGIGAVGADGEPTIFPIVAGAGAEELRASFRRYRKANGVGAKPLASTPLPAASGGGKPRVTFDVNGAHISLTGGAAVDFLAGAIEVTMPTAIPSVPATRISFHSRVRRGIIGQPLAETDITLNGDPMNWQRKGPVWDGLKALVLNLALSIAAQAAHIAANTPGRPANATAYVTLVADAEKHLN